MAFHDTEGTRDGEHGLCETCGESFHWEQLTNTDDGAYCDEHLPREDDDKRTTIRYLRDEANPTSWSYTTSLAVERENIEAGGGTVTGQRLVRVGPLPRIETDYTRPSVDNGADFGHDSAVDRGLGEGIER